MDRVTKRSRAWALGSILLLGVGPARGQDEAKETSASLHWVRDGQPLAERGPRLAMTPPPVEGTDEEGYAVLLVAPASSKLPATLTITSFRAGASPSADAGPSAGRRAAIEVVERALQPVACPPNIEKGRSCAQSAPLRVVIDETDRHHPLLEQRSILGELGGTLSVQAEGVARPFESSIEGDAPRMRAKLRVRLVRMLSKGPAPIGRDSEDAVRLAREEIDRANSVWGVCGVSFGAGADADVSVVDPPPPFLLSVGCEAPALAKHDATFRFAVDGRELSVAIPRGSNPRAAARLVKAALDKWGYRVTVSDNRASHAMTLGSSDVLVLRASGFPATLTAPKSGAVSSDPTLDACIGRVDLEDGLQHFTDTDAVAGTLEERTLVKAFDDGDPSTVEVLVVPSFGGDARIGESFIFLERGAIRNVVLEDRAGFRAQKASFTLAHELGHVLLDQPGHPDDFSGDTPTSLMDADAVDASAFGPRRLSPAECARARRQSGPDGLSPILQPWPLPQAIEEPGRRKGKLTPQ